jgi:hypothetical protein
MRVFVVGNTTFFPAFHVYLYDQRAVGTDADALCSLRFVHELREYVGLRRCDALGHRATTLLTIKDNCGGHTKSKAVLQYYTLLVLLGLYDRIVVVFLGNGQTHMVPDQVMTQLKRGLLGTVDVTSPVELVQHLNDARLPTTVFANFWDHTTTTAAAAPAPPEQLTLWDGWDKVFAAAGIQDLPADIMTHGYFEFTGGTVSVRTSWDVEDVVHEHDAVLPQDLARSRAAALHALFGPNVTLDTADLAHLADGVLERARLRPSPAATQPSCMSAARTRFFVPPEHRRWYPEGFSPDQNDGGTKAGCDDDRTHKEPATAPSAAVPGTTRPVSVSARGPPRHRGGWAGAVRAQQGMG